MSVQDLRDDAQPSSEADLDFGDDSVSSVMSLSTVPAHARRASQTLGSDDAWATRARICQGIPLHHLAQGEGYLRFSSRSVAIPSQPIVIEHASSMDTVITSMPSSREAAFMRLGFSKSAATSTSQCLSILGESEPDRTVPGIHVVCRKVYAQIVVNTELEDLVPHPDFVLDIEKVFTLPTDGQMQALRGALRRWGSIIATHVELGCALVSNTVLPVPGHLPILGWTQNRDDPYALHIAEKSVHNALRTAATENAPGADQTEQDAYTDIARRMPFKAVGGTSKMQMEQCVDEASLSDPKTWTIVGIGSVYPVPDLLRQSHPELYAQVQSLVASAPSANVKTLDPPIYVQPGRMACNTHGNSDTWHISGSVEVQLPGFDPAADFAVSGWVKSGGQHCNAMMLGIGCAELEPDPLLLIGEWDKDGLLKIRRVWLWGESKQSELRWLKSDAIPREQGVWKHMAFTQTHEQMSYFVNGRLVAAVAAVKGSHAPVSKVRLCVGHGIWKHKHCCQWNGEIEGVKLWTRALSQDEIEAEGCQANAPK